MKQNTSVSSVLLNDNPATTAVGFAGLFDALEADLPHSPLVHIDLDWERLGAPLQRRARVWKLRVLGQALASNSVRAETLNLSSAGFMETEVKGMIELLQHNNTARVLDLSGNRTLSDSALRPLTALIPRHETLARVNLRSSGASATLSGMRLSNHTRVFTSLPADCSRPGTVAECCLAFDS
jgi:hypothetical protein